MPGEEKFTWVCKMKHLTGAAVGSEKAAEHQIEHHRPPRQGADVLKLITNLLGLAVSPLPPRPSLQPCPFLGCLSAVSPRVLIQAAGLPQPAGLLPPHTRAHLRPHLAHERTGTRGGQQRCSAFGVCFCACESAFEIVTQPWSSRPMGHRVRTAPICDDSGSRG